MTTRWTWALLAVAVADLLAATAGEIGDPLAAKREEELARRVKQAAIAGPRTEREFSPRAPKAVPVAAKSDESKAFQRPDNWLPADVAAVLTDAFRFNQGVRMTAMVEGRIVVIREEVKPHDDRVRATFERLLEVTESEDASAVEFARATPSEPSLEKFERAVHFEPSLRIELLASRPVVIRFDFVTARAIVEFNGRWSSRALPDTALVALLPAVGSEIYTFLEAESDPERKR
jgi:hypothetical protein